MKTASTQLVPKHGEDMPMNELLQITYFQG